MQIVSLTGAGISAESGLQTFRDTNGLWEGEDVTAVASIEGWREDPARVLRFYNERAEAVAKAYPNAAHVALAELQKVHKLHIITQNVDDLHERAGATSVIHLHGELNKVCSERNPSHPLPRTSSLALGQRCPDGGQIRPFIVWFGEEVPTFPIAVDRMGAVDVCFVVGTSLQVYPAAGLLPHLAASAQLYVICKEILQLPSWPDEQLHFYEESATTGLPKAIEDMYRRLDV